MKKIDLTNIQDGAVTDLFNEELRKVLANIADINTKPDAARSITIKLTVKPKSSREMADVKIDVRSSLTAGAWRHKENKLVPNQEQNRESRAGLCVRRLSVPAA